MAVLYCGIPCGRGHVPAATAASWIELDRRLRELPGVDHVGWCVVTGVSSGPDHARNHVLAQCAAAGLDDLAALLWLDDDQVVEDAGAVARMVSIVLEGQVDSIGAAARLKVPQIRYGVAIGERHPSLPDVYRAAILGAGCWAWSGELVRQLWAAAPRYPLLEPPGEARIVWHAEVRPHSDGRVRLRGEDAALVDLLARNGVTTWCDARVRLGHVGTTTYSGRLADDLTGEDHDEG